MAAMKPETVERLRKRAQVAPFKRKGFVYYWDNEALCELCRINLQTGKYSWYNTKMNTWVEDKYSIEEIVNGEARLEKSDMDEQIYNQFFGGEQSDCASTNGLIQKPLCNTHLKEKIIGRWIHRQDPLEFDTNPESIAIYEKQNKDMLNAIEIKNQEIAVLYQRIASNKGAILLIQIHEERKRGNQ